MAAYLDVYSEAETHEPHLPGEGPFGHVVVVPVCGEGENLGRLIESVPPGPLGTVLVLLVVNARDDHGPETHAANSATLRALAARIAAGEASHRRLLVLDRASPGQRLPTKQGVGLARKIGHDVALALRTGGRIRSRFQHATDADALLPPDVFARVAPYEELSDPPTGLVFPFEHIPDADPAAAAAITLYDIWLRYHHLGLSRAGSPYAYWSIGSTIAVEAGAYGLVRGFPRAMAGEDFYLLDKLAKSGWIERLGGAPIRLAGRPSDRVPFGTGRAVRTIVAEGGTTATYRVLEPRSYTALGAWLSLLEGLPVGPVPPEELAARVVARAAGAGLSPRRADRLATLLDGMGALRFVADSLRLPLSPANLRRRLHTNFDAFRTLKLLHALRDDGMPPVPLEEALAGADFLTDARPFGGAAHAWRRALADLEGRLGRGPTGLLSPARNLGSSRD